MNCDRNALIRAARCFCYLPRTELNGAKIYTLCKWAAASQHTEAVRGWLDRIADAGGDRPSDNTIDALDAFVEGLVEDGIYDKMLMVNCIVPDSLTAARTPLIAIKGYPIWTLVADNDPAHQPTLTVNGFAGANDQDTPIGSYLQTGFNPFHDASKDSFGMTLVSTAANTNTRADFAVIEAFRAQLLCGYSGNTAFFDCWDSGATGRISGPVGWNNGIGYVSGNRLSLTQAFIFSARTGVAHHQVAGPGGDVTADTLPNLLLPLGCWNLNNNYAQNTIKRFSFAATHFGLTAAESLKLFNRIQTMRTSLGGGYI